MATSAQVQQLYIALLGRAADKPGLDWWLENINGGERTLEQAAAAFTTSEEFVSTYGSLQGAELVTAVYTNLFERTPSQEEVAYWVADGRPADELLSAFLTYASPADQTVINNKVTVAQYYTEAAGSVVDLDAAANIIDNVTGDVATVGAALQNLPVTDATLSAALGTWEAAKDAKATFLAGLDDLDNNPATETNDAQVSALIGTTAGPVADFNANTYSAVNLSATSTSAQQEAAFAAARAQYDVAVVAQKAEVTDAQNAVSALADTVDVNAYIAAKAKAAETEAALNPAHAAAVGAIASYEALSSTTAGVDVTAADYSVNTAGAVTIGSTSRLAELATFKDGALALNSGVTETTNPGVTALVNAINADIAAQVADAKADIAVDNAAAKVGSGLADVAKVNTLITEKNELAELQKASEVLEKAIADVKDAYALNAQLTKLDASINSAFGKIAGADLLDGSDLGVDAPTSGADLFIFNGGDQTIDTGFAANDRIFVGSDYTLVDLADLTGKTIGTDAVGSASALEVFWDATSETLYVEKEAFSGSAVGLDNFEIITLTGVSADLEMNAGFIQLA